MRASKRDEREYFSTLFNEGGEIGALFRAS